jgi:2-polyprenyl-3-methyl-5-hydroxy-6-metoxy-1,4-benzoquinol methylase
MTIGRDYDAEARDSTQRRYAYDFDFDVMHPFMMRAFLPFRRPGNCLELGCYKGNFTRHLGAEFNDITCVEASESAIAEAESVVNQDVKFHNAIFERANLPDKYENIFMTHVLEHVDNPVAVLSRVNNEWLSETGVFFLACPNANAPSRQIAVKMGLISHNSAVTEAEAEHGHRRTYTLDTLEKDAVASGLKVIYRSGVFFKAFANFQWDQILHTQIVSRGYLEGCYALGQQYPDLCSTIFIVCERGPNLE